MIVLCCLDATILLYKETPVANSFIFKEVFRWAMLRFNNTLALTLREVDDSSDSLLKQSQILMLFWVRLVGVAMEYLG